MFSSGFTYSSTLVRSAAFCFRSYFHTSLAIFSVQFGGKSYSQEELLKIAKDVWKYDLKQKAADLTSVELYVKPEENMVYYVMNKEITGSFYI